MEQKKKSCENCGHFLQYYAFLGGTFFRPLFCGRCELVKGYKGFVEMRDHVCEKWISNHERLEKQKRVTEERLQNISRQLLDILMILSAKES